MNSCTPMSGRVTNNDDCNDDNATVYPSAAELCANDGVDNDCDGEADADSEASWRLHRKMVSKKLPLSCMATSVFTMFHRF